MTEPSTSTTPTEAPPPPAPPAHHFIAFELRAPKREPESTDPPVTIHDVLRDSSGLEDALEILIREDAQVALVIRCCPGKPPETLGDGERVIEEEERAAIVARHSKYLAEQAELAAKGAPPAPTAPAGGAS